MNTEQIRNIVDSQVKKKLDYFNETMRNIEKAQQQQQKQTQTQDREIQKYDQRLKHLEERQSKNLEDIKEVRTKTEKNSLQQINETQNQIDEFIERTQLKEKSTQIQITYLDQQLLKLNEELKMQSELIKNEIIQMSQQEKDMRKIELEYFNLEQRLEHCQEKILKSDNQIQETTLNIINEIKMVAIKETSKIQEYVENLSNKLNFQMKVQKQPSKLSDSSNFLDFQVKQIADSNQQYQDLGRIQQFSQVAHLSPQQLPFQHRVLNGVQN